MLKLSKKVEYGILAVQYMASKPDDLVRAKEISEKMNLSFDFLAKTLQTLNKNGLISSTQGVHGGYKLSKNVLNITLTDVILSLEERTSIVDCMSPGETDCYRSEGCSLKHPIHILQKKIDQLFDSISISELVNGPNKVSLELEYKKS